MEELKRFETDLKNNEELRKKLEEAIRRFAEEGQVQSDGEVMVKAAKELGYDISVAALEQAKAEAQELDPNALKEVTGGEYDEWNKQKAMEWCMKDYGCWYTYRHPAEDKYGHDDWCLAVWHCSTVTLHTEGESKNEHCWADWHCDLVNKKS